MGKVHLVSLYNLYIILAFPDTTNFIKKLRSQKKEDQVKLIRSKDFENLIKLRQEINLPVLDNSNQRWNQLAANIQTFQSKIGNEDSAVLNYILNVNECLNQAIGNLSKFSPDVAVDMECIKEDQPHHSKNNSIKLNIREPMPAISIFNNNALRQGNSELNTCHQNLASKSSDTSSKITEPNLSQPSAKQSEFAPNISIKDQALESSFPPKNNAGFKFTPEANSNQSPILNLGFTNKLNNESSFPPKKTNKLPVFPGSNFNQNIPHISESFPLNPKNVGLNPGLQNSTNEINNNKGNIVESSFPPKRNAYSIFPGSEVKEADRSNSEINQSNTQNSGLRSFPQNPSPFNASLITKTPAEFSGSNFVKPNQSPFAPANNNPQNLNKSGPGIENIKPPGNHDHNLNQQFEKPKFNESLFILNQLYPTINQKLIDIDPKRNCVVIYHENKVTTVPADQLILVNNIKEFSGFNVFSSSIQIGNTLFFTGGYIGNQIATSAFILSINQSNKIEIESLLNMYYPRDRHSLVYIHDKQSVLACGGPMQKTAEIFDLNIRRWKKIPNMNEARFNSSSIYYNSRYVYLIGGLNINKICLNSIEVLDTNAIDLGFSLIDISNYSINLKTLMGVIQYSKGKFLIFGGSKDQDKTDTSFELELSPDSGKIISFTNSLIKPTEEAMIRSNQLLRVNNEELAAYNSKLEVLSFNFNSKKFSYVAKIE